MQYVWQETPPITMLQWLAKSRQITPQWKAVDHMGSKYLRTNETLIRVMVCEIYRNHCIIIGDLITTQSHSME